MDRNLRKWLIRLGVALTFLVIAVGGYLTWDWYATRSAGEARLAKALAELDSSEPGWRELFAERNKTLAPKERNAASLVRDHWAALPPEFRSSVRSGVLPKEFRQLEKADPNQLWPAPALDAMRKTLVPHGGDLAAIRSHLSNTSNAGFPVDRAIGLATNRDEWDIMAYLALGRWLDADTHIGLADGRAEDAVENVRAMFGLCRVVGDEPSAIAQLLRMAMGTMAVRTCESCLGQSEPKNLPLLLPFVEPESHTDYAEAMILGNRLWVDEMMADLDTAVTPEFYRGLDAKLTPREYPRLWEVLAWKLARKDLPGQRATALERSTEMLRMSRRPYREFATRLKETERQPELKVLSIAIAGYGNYVKSQFETRAQLRTAVAAVACERFRQQYGHWPRDLGEIPPAILPTVPLDPYDDSPIRVANTSTGLVVYSVGSDLKDDGGSLKKNATGGVDVGFRLYDPAHRRVP